MTTSCRFDNKTIVRRVLTKEEKEAIGTVCCSCGTYKNIEYHHIVPLSSGGKDVLTNICSVCCGCHSKIHFGKDGKTIDHSEVTRNGLKRAKARGIRLGGVPGRKLNVKKKSKAMDIISKNYVGFGGTLNKTECAKRAGLAWNTFIKYLGEMEGHGHLPSAP